MDNEADEQRYERARARLPGVLGEQRWMNRFLCALLVAMFVVGVMLLWKSGSELSACKQEKQQGWVVVLDRNGDPVDLPIVSAVEYRLADGLVVKRIEQVVRCLRGLDSNPKVVGACWKDSAGMFSDEAKPKFEQYAKERVPNADAILRAQLREEIAVDILRSDKPDPENAPNRYWLMWTETHKPRSGTAVVETWSGRFDVELLPMEQRSTGGMRIVSWDWKCEKCKGAG